MRTQLILVDAASQNHPRRYSFANRLRGWAARLDPAFPVPASPGSLKVSCEPNGDVVIRAKAIDAARLAGRREFRHTAQVRRALRDGIADAWYESGCPRSQRRNG